MCALDTRLCLTSKPTPSFFYRTEAWQAWLLFQSELRENIEPGVWPVQGGLKEQSTNREDIKHIQDGQIQEICIRAHSVWDELFFTSWAWWPRILKMLWIFFHNRERQNLIMIFCHIRYTNLRKNHFKLSLILAFSINLSFIQLLKVDHL